MPTMQLTCLCVHAASVKKLKEEREKSPPLTQRQEGQSVQDLIRSSLGDYDVCALLLCLDIVTQ